MSILKFLPAFHKKIQSTLPWFRLVSPEKDVIYGKKLADNCLDLKVEIGWTSFSLTLHQQHAERLRDWLMRAYPAGVSNDRVATVLPVSGDKRDPS